jgi:hypothetical protein
MKSDLKRKGLGWGFEGMSMCERIVKLESYQHTHLVFSVLGQEKSTEMC